MRTLFISILLYVCQFSYGQSFPGGRYATQSYFAQYWGQNISCSTHTPEKFHGRLLRPDNTTVELVWSQTTENGRRLEHKGNGLYAFGLLATDIPESVTGCYGIAMSASDCVTLTWHFDVLAATRYADAFSSTVTLSNLLKSAGVIPPASGMTRPAVYASREGTGTKKAVFEGISLSSAKPTVSFTLYDVATPYLIRATAASFDYYTNTTEEGLYRHVFTYESLFQGTPLADGDYGGLFASQNDGQWVVTPFTLILSPTPEIDTTDLPTKDWLTAGLIHPTSQSFNDLLSGFPFKWETLLTNKAISRTLVGSSSASDINMASGEIVAVSTTHTDHFSGITVQENRIYDTTVQTGERMTSYEVTTDIIEWLDTYFGVDPIRAGE